GHAKDILPNASSLVRTVRRTRAYARQEILTPASSAAPPQHKGPLIVAASVSALGGLLFGYDNIVISGAIHYLALCFKLDAAGIGWAAGCALIGCTVGAAGAGAGVDRIGLKKGVRALARGVCFAVLRG